MADIKFSEFPKATTSKDSDEIAILQDGVNKMIPSPVLESKIINKTVSRVIDQGGVSLNVVNLKGVVPTYADLALITPTPELNDAYQVVADGLVYVYTESGFQSEGEGIVVQPENKIPDWIATPYPAGTQIFHDGQIWTSRIATVAADVPGETSKWIPKMDMIRKSSLIPSDYSRGNQLFNKLDYLKNYGISFSTGNYVPADGTETTHMYEIKEGETHVTLSGMLAGVLNQVFYYDAEGVYISRQASSSGTLIGEFPANAKYFAAKFHDPASPGSSAETFMLNYGTGALPYEPFLGEIETIEGYHIENLRSTFKGTRIGNQRFDKRDVLLNTKLMGGAPEYNLNSRDETTTLIPVSIEDGRVFLSGMSEGTHKIAFYDIDKNLLVEYQSFTGTTHDRGIPAGSAFLAVWFNDGSVSESSRDTFMVNYGVSELPYEPFKEELTEIDGYKIISTEDVKDLIPPPPVIPEPYKTPQWRDTRYTDDFKYKEFQRLVENQQNTLKSLRSIKTTDSGVKTFNIPNTTGAVQTDVNLILKLHHGSNTEGTEENFDLYMDGFGKTDFSDIRFLDNNDNLLDFNKISSGNYELVADERLRTFIITLADGTVWGSNANGSSGIEQTMDGGKTWTNKIVSDGRVLGGNADSDIFYAVGYQVYKVKKSEGYANPTMVLEWNYSGYSFQPLRFLMDDIGNLYMGLYQTPYNATVMKSIDGGDTWSVVFNNPERQHCHSLEIDLSVSPPIIYANFDGSTGGAPESEPTDISPITYYTTDRGNSWHIYELPWRTDYGVLYVGDGYTIGGGESSKGFPTLFKKYADGTVKVVLETQQWTLLCKEIKGALYVFAGSYHMNKYPQVFRSDDDGETWVTVHTDSYHDEIGTSNNNRYGLHRGTLPATIDYEEQLLVTSYYERLPNLRIFEGGEHYQGLYYVKVPVLPIGGIDIKVGYGYLTEDIEGNLFSENINTSGLIHHLPLNEYGRFVYDNVTGYSHELGDDIDWSGDVSRRFGSNVPFMTPAHSAGVSFSDTSYITLVNEGQLNFNKGFTVNFWIKLRQYNQYGSKFLFGRPSKSSPDDAFFFLRYNPSTLRVRHSGKWTQFPVLPFKKNNEELPLMLTIVITDDVIPEMRMYWNGGRIDIDGFEPGEFILDGFNNSMQFGDWAIGGRHSTGSYGNMAPEDGWFTDFKIFNRVLSDDEVRKEFEGSNLLRP